MDQITRLVADFLAARRAYQMKRQHELIAQMEKYLASIPTGPTDSLTKSNTTCEPAASNVPTSTTRRKSEPTLRLKSIVD